MNLCEAVVEQFVSKSKSIRSIDFERAVRYPLRKTLILPAHDSE